MDQQPTQPIQNIQPDIQSNKPANKSWQIAGLVVAGILVLGGIAYGSYYWWQNSTGKLSQNLSPSVSVSPSGTPDEMVGWQTYRNEEYGYELRYPPLPNFQPYDKAEYNKETGKDYKFVLSDSNTATLYFCGPGTSRKSKLEDILFGCGWEMPAYVISVSQFKYQTLEDMLKNQKNPDGLPWIKDFSSEVKEITIGGVKGLSAPSNIFRGAPVSDYIVHNGYLYEFINNASASGRAPGLFNDKFGEMLSTFKFIDICADQPKMLKMFFKDNPAANKIFILSNGIYSPISEEEWNRKNYNSFCVNSVDFGELNNDEINKLANSNFLNDVPSMVESKYYSNKNLGIEFKIPNDWSYQEYSNGNVLFSNKFSGQLLKLLVNLENLGVKFGAQIENVQKIEVGGKSGYIISSIYKPQVINLKGEVKTKKYYLIVFPGFNLLFDDYKENNTEIIFKEIVSSLKKI